MSLRGGTPTQPEPRKNSDIEAGKLWVEEQLSKLVAAAGGHSCVFEWEDPTRRSATDLLEGRVGLALFRGFARNVVRFLGSELEDVEGDLKLQEELIHRLKETIRT